MEKSEELKKIDEIRSLMMRSSRFISLSGLSGVIAGVAAIVGAAAAYYYLDLDHIPSQRDYVQSRGAGELWDSDVFWFCVADALLVLAVSLVAGVVLTVKKAKKEGQQILGGPARRLATSLLIPLVTGGVFCIVLIFQNLTFLIAPAMLIFYGLALVNGSHFTLNEVRYLGIAEIIIGIIAAVMVGYGLLFWTIGFGVLHVLYGIVMYVRHEQ